MRDTPLDYLIAFVLFVIPWGDPLLWFAAGVGSALLVLAVV
jgi:hypothetical protein